MSITVACIVVVCFVLPGVLVAWDHRGRQVRYRVVNRQTGETVYRSRSVDKAMERYTAHRTAHHITHPGRPCPFDLEGIVR